MLARLGARGSSLDKDKSDSVDGSATSATAVNPLLTQAADGSARMQRYEAPTANQPPKANILRQETHFAPVAPAPSSGPNPGAAAEETAKPGVGSEAMQGEAAPSVDGAQPSFEGSLSVGGPPAQQIADRVTAEAASAPEFADRTGTTPEQLGTKPALKILHIALQPGDLGTVTVRMELKDAELTLHVEAERPETANLIRNDQDALTNLLRSAGYAVDAGSIRVADAASSAPSGQNGTQTNLQSSPQSQSGASERQGHGHRGSGGSNGGDSGPQASRNDTHETTTNRAGVGLYI
jgi:chemotaxis protein MotD